MQNARTEKFAFLDGMRALAMLNVLIFHALTITPGTAGPTMQFLERYSLHGQTGVVVFIVLSGYCLMLPVARSEDGALRGGLTGFFRRRAWRILPAYYAVLAACIALAYGMTALSSHFGSRLADYSEVLTLNNVITHVTLTHNLFRDTAFTLNGALWSVATEWQIYFVFALILLPLWRRFGILIATVVALILGYLPGFLLSQEHSLYWARPWYLGMFAIGMCAACVDFRPESRDIASLRRFSPFLPALSALSAIALLVVHLRWGLPPSWPIDTLIAVTTALLISNCIRIPRRAATRFASPFQSVRNALEHPLLLRAAGFSYTAYLIQHIVYKGCLLISNASHLSSSQSFLVNFLLGIPVILVASFYLSKYLERPFVSRPAGTKIEPSR